jgi:hypothetical protein
MTAIVAPEGATEHELRPGITAASPARITLRRSAQIDLEQAELFLLSLEHETLGGEPRAAYLLGLAEAHLANMLELIRAVAA